MPRLAALISCGGPTPAVTIWLACGLLMSMAGCDNVRVPPQDAAMESLLLLEDDDELKRQLDDVLQFTLRDRRLNTEDHAAWQILHGALAYQREFPLQVGHDGPTRSAVEHLLSGGEIEGWEAKPGDVLDAKTGRRGLRAIMEAGSKSGQGHADQWLAVLAQCGLPPEQTIQVDDATYTMSDFVTQVQRDVPRNVDREWSWTLIGLTTYLPTTAKWIAGDGHQWTIERLVQLEAEQEIDSSTCGGTHRLIGLAMTLNRHLAQGGALEGPWTLADEVIQLHIQKARQLQNPDGSFSTNYFSRGGRSPDLADTIGTTGHTLEFLAIAMTDAQLAESWVRGAAFRMCDVFRKTKEMPLECGALYHAAHGLVLLRHRLFGAVTYSATGDSKAD